MKSLILSGILASLFLFQAYAGSDPYIVIYSPDNPVVGETVTFTFSDGNMYCTYSVNPDKEGPGVGFSPFPGASHIYTTAGTYTVLLDENCPPVRLVGDGLVGAGFWQLRNSSGIVSSNKTITVTAPIPASSIPTMGEWSIIALAISLVIFSIVGIKEIARNKRNAMH